MSRIPIPVNHHQAATLNHSSSSSFTSSTVTNNQTDTNTPTMSSSGLLPGSPSALSATATDTRKKQSRRDETLRRKLEAELSRKRPGPNPGTQSSNSGYFGNTTSASNPGASPAPQQRSSSKKALKGTVAGLKPSPALTVPENMTVSDASQLCAAKRTDCVLVVDDEEGLSGIFTAKDLAFRVSEEREREREMGTSVPVFVLLISLSFS